MGIDVHRGETRSAHLEMGVLRETCRLISEVDVLHVQRCGAANDNTKAHRSRCADLHGTMSVPGTDGAHTGFHHDFTRPPPARWRRRPGPLRWRRRQIAPFDVHRLEEKERKAGIRRGQPSHAVATRHICAPLASAEDDAQRRVQSLATIVQLAREGAPNVGEVLAGEEQEFRRELLVPIGRREKSRGERAISQSAVRSPSDLGAAGERPAARPPFQGEGAPPPSQADTNGPGLEVCPAEGPKARRVPAGSCSTRTSERRESLRNYAQCSRTCARTTEIGRNSLTKVADETSSSGQHPTRRCAGDATARTGRGLLCPPAHGLPGARDWSKSQIIAASGRARPFRSSMAGPTLGKIR